MQVLGALHGDFANGETLWAMVAAMRFAVKTHLKKILNNDC